MNTQIESFIPKGVTDEAAYYEYIALQDDLNNHPNRIIQTSNPKLKVDLAATITILNKLIKGLPEDEQEVIRGKTTEIRKLIGAIATAKRKAYGTLLGKKESEGLGPAAAKKTEILDLFGRFYKPNEVHKIIVTEWGMDISGQAILDFYKNNITKIEELKKEYEQDYSDIRLGKRRSRLDEYTWLYGHVKDKYVQFNAREDAKLLKELLESIKKEVDGDLVINGKLQVDIEQTINLQVQQDLLKEFNITALIIAKLAGRLNINPLFLTSRLANSHYAKFTGFAKPDNNRMEDEIYSPTNITYNWDEIVSLNEQLIKDANKQKELGGVEDAIIVEENNIETPKPTMSIKEMMLAKLRTKQAPFEAIIPKNRE